MIEISIPNPRIAVKPTKLRLYHGTSAAYVPEILKRGLLPRSSSLQNNFGSQDLASIAEHIYLGTKEFLFYSVVAATASSELHRLAVVEVELDFLDFDKLHPNEDTIWSFLRSEGVPEFQTMHPVPAIKRCIPLVFENQCLWYELLLRLFSVAHKGRIPISAIHRVSVFEFNGIINDLFYERQSTLRETEVDFMPLSDGSYEIMAKWLHGRGMKKEALELLKTDAVAKGYQLPNLKHWNSEFEKMTRNGPVVFNPAKLDRRDIDLAIRLSRPLKNSGYQTVPLWNEIPLGPK